VDVGNILVWIVWFAAAFACLGSGIAVVTFANPFYSALALIGNLASLAVLYLLLSAEFVAAAQVLVYAGAVMVMFLFVIGYLGGRADAPWAGGPSWQQVAAICAAGALLVEIVVAVGLKAGDRLDDEATIGASFGSPQEIGRLFLTNNLLAFEITSIVLLVAAGGRCDPRRTLAALRPAGRAPMMGPEVTWYLIVASILFTIGALGVLVRRSPLIILLSLEIMLNGANLALIAFARHQGDADGQIFALTVMAVAASEVVVGLGLIVAMSRRRLPLDVDRMTTLRG
jgi:NADH-quinone oxidoreductase subunit K